MSENTEEINELKRKAKELSEQASDYEFGFEVPSKKNQVMKQSKCLLFMAQIIDYDD